MVFPLSVGSVCAQNTCCHPARGARCDENGACDGAGCDWSDGCDYSCDWNEGFVSCCDWCVEVAMPAPDSLSQIWGTPFAAGADATRAVIGIRVVTGGAVTDPGMGVCIRCCLFGFLCDVLSVEYLKHVSR